MTLISCLFLVAIGILLPFLDKIILYFLPNSNLHNYNYTNEFDEIMEKDDN